MRMQMLSAPFEFRRVPEGPTTSDRWFAALDQRLIDVGAERWRAHVLGIHGEGGELWIQIAQAHEPDRGLVIHCWQTQAVDEVLAAVSTAHLGSSGSMPHIVEAFRVM
jgi:hypothetical protein